MKKKIGVIFGGKSVEHEISIITAIQAIENMDRHKYDITPIYISKDGIWYTSNQFFNTDTFKDMNLIKKNAFNVHIVKENNEFYLKSIKSGLFTKSFSTKLDLVMPIVHGTSVEDGTLSGFFETIGIPYTGPNVTSGSIGQDKAVMKDILKSNGISQTKFLWYYKSQEVDLIVKEVIDELELPVIVKPATLGSSVAISVVDSKDELIAALELAFDFCHKVVVEKLVSDFQEVNISVLGNYKNVILSKTELVAKDEDFLSYSDKYLSGSKKGKEIEQSSSGMASLSRTIPAPVSKHVQKQIEEISKKAFRVLNCEGVIRIDLMIKDEVVYLNEVNNIPGSLSFYLWEATEIPYNQLLDKIIDLGISSYFEKEKTINSIGTNVLNMKGSKSK